MKERAVIADVLASADQLADVRCVAAYVARPHEPGTLPLIERLAERGVRILPGGDYGFAWTPHGTNAKDLEYFVKYVGMSTMEALLSATAWGGPMMKMGKTIGYIREGCFADILLIDGDPLADITVLQDKARILAVMKDGQFHRAPAVRGARSTTRWAA